MNQSINNPLHNLFSLRPPSDNISKIKQLRPFIDDYPNQALHAKLYELQQQYHYYRAICGDGNCFYRAVMFLYLRLVDLKEFTRVFRRVQLVCQNLPIDLQDCNQENLLQELWKHYLLPIAHLKGSQRQQKLEKYFNQSWAFDAVLIAYFRSLNYYHIRNNQDKYSEFVGNIHDEENKVKRFNEESQGIQLFTLAEILNVKLTVMMTLETTLKEVVMGNGQDNFVLFYRPGHYDILYERILQENVNPEPTYWKSTTTKTYNRTVITRPAQINQLTQLKQKSIKINGQQFKSQLMPNQPTPNILQQKQTGASFGRKTLTPMIQKPYNNNIEGRTRIISSNNPFKKDPTSNQPLTFNLSLPGKQHIDKIRLSFEISILIILLLLILLLYKKYL